MTFCAGNRNVSPFKWILCGGMFGYGEFRLLEAIYRVTGFAGSAVSPRAELASMRVLMAIRTMFVCKRSGKVQAMVASAALYSSVFPKERILSLRVVKAAPKSGLLTLFPRGRRMTGIAVTLECTFVWVRMTRRALVKGKSLVFDRLRPGELMTLCATQPRMRPHQREPRLGMIESRWFFPLIESVAPCAFFS